MSKKRQLASVLCVLSVFAFTVFLESGAWARAGGGRSAGSRGSKSFSSPEAPSSVSPGSPGMSTPGRNSLPGSPAQPSGGFFGRSPFMQGLAGGLAGGLLGSMLFGGTSHAAPGGVGSGGIGFMDIAILGILLYVAYRFFKKRREQSAVAAGYYGTSPQTESYQGFTSTAGAYDVGAAPEATPAYDGMNRGIEQIRRYDPDFDEEAFKSTAQDLFFRIQAGWANRSLDGIENILTGEMAGQFRQEFDSMKQKNVMNRLENIAVRKVELTEAWQEAGKDYITVLLTANLLDYTVDATTREVVSGDKLNPIKFQEFWTFVRDMGSMGWRLSAIDQT